MTMNEKREDVQILLQLDQVYRPKTEAKKFAYSEELADVVKAGSFFETYALDSDERFYINEIATYFEMLGMLWETKIVDDRLAVEWSGTRYYWELIGPILVQARDVFNSPNLWEYFEALAMAHMELK